MGHRLEGLRCFGVRAPPPVLPPLGLSRNTCPHSDSGAILDSVAIRSYLTTVSGKPACPGNLAQNAHHTRVSPEEGWDSRRSAEAEGNRKVGKSARGPGSYWLMRILEESERTTDPVHEKYGPEVTQSFNPCRVGASKTGGGNGRMAS